MKRFLLVFLFSGHLLPCSAQTDTLPGIRCIIRGTDTLYRVTNKSALHGFWINENFSGGKYELAGKPMPQGWEKLPPRIFLEKVTERHYSYSQLCSHPKQKKHSEFSYGGLPWQFNHMQASGFQLIRQRRSELILYYTGSGAMWRIRTVDDLNILIELNAVEALPILNSYIKKLEPVVLAAQANRLEFDSAFSGYKDSEIHHLTHAYQYALATVVCLLRQEKYAPLLRSEMEKEFATKLAQGKADTLAPEAKARELVFNDPVHKYTRTSSFRTLVPMDRIHIRQIETWADDYCLRLLPEAKQTAATRMNPWPVSR